MADQHERVLQRQRLLRARKSYSRNLEDVDYWRKRAGWADDDETMKSYNQGVYNTYYLGDNENNGGGSSSSSVSKKNNQSSIKLSDHLGWIIGLASALIFLILLVKCCSADPTEKSRKHRTSSSAKSRDSSRSLRDKHADRRSRSRSRARSKSRTRSKSRSRGEVIDDYKLMDGDDDNHSRKSSKSKKSSRSRSRSKTRSKSRTRDRESKRESDGNVTMLV
ncbi:hypothetical protein ACHAW6_011076 [Cyclotella cf. meneghiniana]